MKTWSLLLELPRPRGRRTTLLYAEQSDATADAELRAWHQKRLQKG